MKKRHTFIVSDHLANVQLEICENLYNQDGGRQKINNYADKVKMPYSKCNGCESVTPTAVKRLSDSCAVCGGSKLIQKKY